MKLKQPTELPNQRSYIRFEDCGYIDFDNGKLIFDHGTIGKELTKEQTKELFSAMLIHYMASGDGDLFE